MPAPTPSPFMASLYEIMKSGVAAVALNEEDIFFLANDECLKPDRIHYHEYRKFVDALMANNKVPLHSLAEEAFYEIYGYLRAQKLKQKLAMLNAIAEGKSDWRRYCWLLDLQAKEERAKATRHKEIDREAKKAGKESGLPPVEPAETSNPSEPSAQRSIPYSEATSNSNEARYRGAA